VSLAVALASIFVTMTLALARAKLGPSAFDRIVALNMFGTKTVLFLCVICMLTGRHDFLDIALIYALMNFVGTLAVLRFSRFGHFADTHDDEERG
jgi:multicomponent Na+:H+ antiporter subunit F